MQGILLEFDLPIFSYPGFINQDREIVFEVWSTEEDVVRFHLARQPLTDDGFSSLGKPRLFVPYSQSPLAIILSTEASSLVKGREIAAVEEQAGASQPAAFSLGQNYPNPFNAGTLISYSVPSAGTVILEIFNIQGQRVATLDQGMRPAGAHTASWTGIGAERQPLASGVYFYRLRLPGGEGRIERKMHKMLLLR